MNAFQPGFVDDPKSPEPPAAVRTEPVQRHLDPGFMETTSRPPEAVPATMPIPAPSPGLGAPGWMGAGLGILIVGGSLLSLIGFVVDQMARSQILGGASLATVIAGVFAIVFACFERTKYEDWYAWGILASILVCAGLYFIMSGFVHKVKSDLIKRQKLREQQKTFTAD